MHDWRFPDDFVAKVVARRGRFHAFEALDARRSALVVIDMQTAFVGPGGVVAARAVVPAINRLAAALRRAGGLVVWVQSSSESWPDLMAEVLGRANARRTRAALAEGAAGHALWHELEVEAADWRASKTR